MPDDPGFCQAASQPEGSTWQAFAFPNLLAINFVVKGLLGDGVLASLRSEPQAKSLGESLRAKLVAIPISLQESSSRLEGDSLLASSSLMANDPWLRENPPALDLGVHIESAHSADEFVTVEQLIDHTKTIALSIMRWSGVRESAGR